MFNYSKHLQLAGHQETLSLETPTPVCVFLFVFYLPSNLRDLAKSITTTPQLILVTFLTYNFSIFTNGLHSNATVYDLINPQRAARGL